MPLLRTLDPRVKARAIESAARVFLNVSILYPEPSLAPSDAAAAVPAAIGAFPKKRKHPHPSLHLHSLKPILPRPSALQ